MSYLPHFFHFPGKHQASVVADTEGIVYLGSHSIRNSLPLQEEATGRQPEDLLTALSFLQTAAQAGLAHNPSGD